MKAVDEFISALRREHEEATEQRMPLDDLARYADLVGIPSAGPEVAAASRLSGPSPSHLREVITDEVPADRNRMSSESDVDLIEAAPIRLQVLPEGNLVFGSGSVQADGQIDVEIRLGTRADGSLEVVATNMLTGHVAGTVVLLSDDSQKPKSTSLRLVSV